jgi:hypothetical protein
MPLCYHGSSIFDPCESCLALEEQEEAEKRAAFRASVRLDAYGIVQRAVEEGVSRGYRRAFKHTDAPGEESIRASIEREVMDALCEVLRFD